MFEELKKTVANDFFLHFMKRTLKQMSHLRFLLLLTQIKLELQKCGKSQMQVQQMETKTRNRINQSINQQLYLSV